MLALGLATGARPEAPAMPAVEVQLTSWGAIQNVQLSGEGLVLRDDGGQRLFRGERPRKLTIRRVGNSLLLVAGNKERRIASPLRAEATAGVTVTIGSRKRQYAGTLMVSVRGGRLRLTSVVPFEEYIASVLSAEVPALFPLEARKAAAVATRSYTVRKLWVAPAREGLCDTHHCQVYPGTLGVRAAHREGAEATVGQIALFEGEPIEAVYSSDCGGWTAANEEAWPGSQPVPYLRGRLDASSPDTDPYCIVNRAHEWEREISQAALRRLAADASGPMDVSILERSASGRVLRLRVGRRELTGDAFRRALGAAVVKSQRFEITTSGSGITLRGRGAGHGVGLCQFGASGMARAGHGYRDIIKHYYRGVSIAKTPRQLARRLAKHEAGSVRLAANR